LLPLPETVRTLSAVFQRIEDAANAVAAIMCSGIIPRTVEYMDQAAIQCVEDYLRVGLPIDAGAMLLVDVDGSADACDVALQHLADICKAKKAGQVALAGTEDKINEDIVVPRSQIPAMVKWVDGLRKRSGLTIVTFGHAGDGNMHCNIMLDKRDNEALRKAEAAVEALFKKTIALGGTISGEHGVGVSKAPYLAMEIGREEIALMKRIKTSFDPKGILNPGKIFP
jgi:glycolate oxidase